MNKSASNGSRIRVVIFAAALMAIADAWFFFIRNGQGDLVSLRTASVERGPIISTVSTGGTLNATRTVRL